MNINDSKGNNGRPRGNIMQLPTETLTEIMSYALGSVDLRCEEAMKWTSELQKPRPLLNLKLVCKRFHTISLEALSKRKHIDVNLIGPVPVDNKERMDEVHKYYTSLLMANFQPAIEKNRSQGVRISLLPALNSQIPPAGINWAPHDPQRPTGIDKDDATVRKVMVSHQAAAILLSAIMHSIVLKHPKLRLLIVFHEVDWMVSRFREEEEGQSVTLAPKVNPFWDLTGVCGIVYHWRWLREQCKKQHKNFSDVFLTPNIALALNVDHRWGWDSYLPRKTVVITALQADPEALARHAFDFSLAKLIATWSDSPDAQWSRGTVARPVRHYIPGYPKKVVCSENQVFAQWLTTICRDSHNTMCFVIRGAGTSEVARPSDVATKLEAPSGRTLMIHTFCR